VGAGPAGMGLALCCRELGFACTLLDPEGPGGILRISGWPMSWALGLPGATGGEVASKMAAHVRQEGIPIRQERALSIEVAARCLRLEGADPLPYDALVVATGVRFRRAELPGENEAEAAEWLFHRPPLSPQAGALSGAPGRRVIVLGGGNNAFSTAVAEAATAREVVIALRGEQPRAHARAILEAATLANISVRTGYRALRVVSSPRREIHFLTPQGEKALPCDAAYVHYGYAPNSEWTAGAVKVTGEGHIEIDPEFRTSAPRVWAVGEVVGPAAPCVQTVLAHAPVAALSIARALRDEAAVAAALRQLESRAV